MDALSKIIDMLKALPPDMLKGRIEIIGMWDSTEAPMSPKVTKLVKVFDSLSPEEQKQCHELIMGKIGVSSSCNDWSCDKKEDSYDL